MTVSGNDAAETRALRTLEHTGDAIASAVERCLPQWILRQVTPVLDAWGRLDQQARGHIERDIAAAADAAARRVGAALHTLARTGPDEQRVTPLQILRSATREATAVLAAAGVAPIVRDEFDRRSFPDDAYGLTPRTFADLGDDDLTTSHLAWGAAKAMVMRVRHE